MIERDDIRAAVAAGILTEAQAASLSALSHSRRGARESLRPEDEPFELFKGFNEIFIVVGLIILAMGWSGLILAATSGVIRNVIGFAMTSAAVSAAVIWALSEYFIRVRRMIAPAITLTLFWAGNAVTGLMAWGAEPFMVGRGDWTSLPLPFGLSALAVLVFWWRFRVPIALPVAILLVFAALVAGSIGTGEPPQSLEEFFLLSGEGIVPWITLGLGIFAFGLAMAFDMSDPHRVTRRASNGFWLHILAAPAIVNTLALTLLSQDGLSGILIALLTIIAAVAIVIDRRSFLIAGAGYAVALATTVSGTEGAAWTILMLGVVLLLTGAFWERIRAFMLARLAPILPLSRLPPAVTGPPA